MQYILNLQFDRQFQNFPIKPEKLTNYYNSEYIYIIASKVEKYTKIVYVPTMAFFKGFSNWIPRPVDPRLSIQITTYPDSIKFCNRNSSRVVL